MLRIRRKYHKNGYVTAHHISHKNRFRRADFYDSFSSRRSLFCDWGVVGAAPYRCAGSNEPGAIGMRNETQNVGANCHPAPPGCNAKALPGGSGKKRFCMHPVRIIRGHGPPPYGCNEEALPGAIGMRNETQNVRAHCQRRLAAGDYRFSSFAAAWASNSIA